MCATFFLQYTIFNVCDLCPGVLTFTLEAFFSLFFCLLFFPFSPCLKCENNKQNMFAIQKMVTTNQFKNARTTTATATTWPWFPSFYQGNWKLSASNSELRANSSISYRNINLSLQLLYVLFLPFQTPCFLKNKQN